MRTRIPLVHKNFYIISNEFINLVSLRNERRTKKKTQNEFIIIRFFSIFRSNRRKKKNCVSVCGGMPNSEQPCSPSNYDIIFRIEHYFLSILFAISDFFQISLCNASKFDCLSTAFVCTLTHIKTSFVCSG